MNEIDNIAHLKRDNKMVNIALSTMNITVTTKFLNRFRKWFLSFDHNFRITANVNKRNTATYQNRLSGT